MRSCVLVCSTISEGQSASSDLYRLARSGWIVLLFLMAVLPAASQVTHTKPTASEPTPEAAIPTILATFDRYEVVAMPAAHGMKDLDDFVLSLIRDPAFPVKVNDIAVECGNALYQPVLDRYIAGEDVPFTEARKAWRNTTQSMCSYSGFYEQLFLSFAPLIRNSPQLGASACWLAIPPLIGTRSRPSKKQTNLSIA